MSARTTAAAHRASVPGPGGAVDVATLRAGLARTSDDVEVRETHHSVVLLADDRAFRVLKPVALPFVDHRTLQARAAACRGATVLNRDLAPDLVVGARAVVPAAEGYTLEGPEDPRAIDHVVQMRRYDEAATMRALAVAGTLTGQQAAAAGARLAAFHRDATVCRAGVDYRVRINRVLEAMLPLTERLLPARDCLALQRAAAAFLLSWAPVLAARASAGNVVDGHGDVRAAHVVFGEGVVQVVDRPGVDDLRVVDVADELALLLMELEDITASRALGEAVLTGYVAGGGTRPPDALLAFFGAYRALVRAMDALLRGEQPGADREAGRAQARRLLALGRRLAWRSHGPLILLVTGPPAAGKSTLARALAEASGLPLLSSDAVRRERQEATPDYSLEGRASIYTELARRAGTRGAAIVDATFGHPRLQQAFMTELHAADAADPLIVECGAPEAVRVERARARSRRVAPDSDATPQIAVALGRRYDPIEAPDDARVTVDTRAPIGTQVDIVESWLDSLLAAGRGGE